MLLSFDHMEDSAHLQEKIYDRTSHTELARVLAVSPLYMEGFFGTLVCIKREKRDAHTQRCRGELGLLHCESSMCLPWCSSLRNPGCPSDYMSNPTENLDASS